MSLEAHLGSSIGQYEQRLQNLIHCSNRHLAIVLMGNFLSADTDVTNTLQPLTILCFKVSKYYLKALVCAPLGKVPLGSLQTLVISLLTVNPDQRLRKARWAQLRHLTGMTAAYI